MFTVNEAEIFLRLLYQDTAIPAYLYKGTDLVFSYPKQTEFTYPPLKYLSELSQNTSSVSYCISEYGTYYGCVMILDSPDLRILFGPVSSIPYDESSFFHMFSDYAVPKEKQDMFRSFFSFCPQLSLTGLLLKLIFLNYCINREELSINSFMQKAEDNIPSDMTEQARDKTYQAKESMSHNRSYEVGTVYFDLIRSGNVKAMKEMIFNDSDIHVGTLSNSRIRQLKDTIIVVTALATRAAIDGGLDTDTAYTLSDTYIQNTERITDIDSLYHLLTHICLDFAERVSETKTPETSDNLLQETIRYVLQNTNTNLTIADVAEHAGFSPSYFAGYFKKNMGFPLGAFIKRCKLEEARYLLSNTKRSISSISSYLCFSSQSHFQTAFKKQFGVTPLQYRKNPTLHSH